VVETHEKVQKPPKLDQVIGKLRASILAFFPGAEGKRTKERKGSELNSFEQREGKDERSEAIVLGKFI